MEKMEPRTLPGFMELYPHEQIEFDRIKNTIIDTYKKYGFYPLDTPIIEYSDVLLAKAGGETEKQIYRFMKGENDLSLRFDLTVPLSKYVAKRHNELVFPFKRFQIGKVFRGERPQKGRYREFYQCDIDVIGDEELSIRYDAEMPSIIYDIFTKLNIGDFVIRINNRKLLSGYFNNLGLKDKITDILRIIDKIEKIGEEEVKKELAELGLNEDQIRRSLNFIKIEGTNQEIIEALKQMNIEDETFQKGIEEIESVINDLRARRITTENYEIDLTIARGLDYYTGTVYETILKDYPNLGSVCSGGRYDNLAEYYTDKKLPGVGISIGLTRLFYLLTEYNIIETDKSSPSDILIIPMCEDYEYIYEIKDLLLNLGITTNICYLDKGMKQKMKYANKLRTKYVVIIGEDEVNNNTIVLKNMYEGIQFTLNREEIMNIKETYLF